MTDTVHPDRGSPTPDLDRLRRMRRALSESLDAIEIELRRSETPRRRGAAPAPEPEDVLGACLGPVVDELEGSRAFRVLRRLAPDAVDASGSARPHGASVAVLVDVETTGLDHRSDEVIEVGMVRFEHVDGAVTRVVGEMSALREPSRPISPEITRLTGITPAMVAGCRLDPDAISDMLLGADLVIAHHAAFDRPFCEALHGGFAALPWACSVQEVDWAAAGFEGAKLGHLLLQSGSFHRGHRALDDCWALMHLLRVERPSSAAGGAAPLLRGLVDSAAETRRRVWAEGAPFERRGLLKARGYRWSPGDAAAPRAWWRDVPEEGWRAELQFLHEQIYGRHRPLRTERVTARDRYRPL